jgi:hypothetical protein
MQRSRWPWLALVASLVLAPPAPADHSFPVPEEFDEPGTDLADATEITEEVVLMGASGLFTRVPVGPDFLADPILPVSDDAPGDVPGEEQELQWAVSEFGNDRTLALTPDTVAGTYPGLGVHVATIAAAEGELEQSAEPGVVARYSQGIFYAATAFVVGPPAAASVYLKLGRWDGGVIAALAEFSDADDDPEDDGLSELFDYTEGENLRLRLEVTVPDVGSDLCAVLERVVVRRGALAFERLATIAGHDGSILTGRAGLHAASGTVNEAIRIGFDRTTLNVIPVLSVPCLFPRLRGILGGLSPSPQDGEMTGLTDDVNLRWKVRLERRAVRSLRALDRGRPPAVARGLGRIRLRADGSPVPADWVAGAAAAAVRNAVDAMLAQLASP